MVNALKHTSGRDSFLFQMSEMNIQFIEDEVRKKLKVSESPTKLFRQVEVDIYI